MIAPSDFPPEASQAAGYAFGSLMTFVSSVVSAVLAAAIGAWLGIGREKKAQVERLTLIIERKYLIIRDAVRKAVGSPVDCETHAVALIAVVRRELGSALAYCADLPLRALEDAVSGAKPKDKPVAKPETKPVQAVPVTLTLEEAKVLKPGLFGGDIGDGYVVRDVTAVATKPDHTLSESEVLEARRFRVWQAVSRFDAYWSDKGARVAEMRAVQAAFAVEVPPKPPSTKPGHH